MSKQTANKHMGKLIIAFVIFVATFWAAFTWWHMSLYAPGPLTESKTIIIENGKSSAAIAKQLEESGIVNDAFMFRIALRTSLSDRFLKAGEYAFDPKISVRKVIQKLTGGDVLNRSLTIPEGYSFAQIRELLMAEEGLSGPPLAFEEGALLAETYHFKYGTKRADLMRKMAIEMNAVVEEAWANRAPNLPLNSPQELLTLASIVEKETAIPSERTVIASVFINRLNKGMRLQADPTVVYGASDYAGDITYAHLRENHAYNTYVHKGLPPTPIASPGKEAILASANPAQTDFLYFVADGTGKHIFAKTYAEHKKNVAAYLASLNK